MRRMRFVSRRGVVAVVVVVGLVAACVGGWRLVRSLQYRAAVRVAASVRASTTATVADDVGVCDLVPAGVIESIAGRQINNFWMYRSNNKLMCLVYLQERKPLHYRVRNLCAEGKIPGAYQEGRAWKIPYDATKPSDERYKNKESLIPILEDKLKVLKKRRPLTEGELERLNEEFLTEYIYNSNAIEGNTLTLRETDMVLRGLTIDKKSLK